MKKQLIHVYGTDRTNIVEVTERCVREGIVTYKNHKYRVFDNNGQPSILSDKPITHPLHAYEDEAIIDRALDLLKDRIMTGPFMSSPDDVKNFLKLRSKGVKREIFNVIYLNHKNALISIVDHTIGDGSSAPVYPHIIMAEALRLSASALVLHHNHPANSCPKPSSADRHITKTLKGAADVFSIRIIDHIISSGTQSYSFAENGDI